MQDCILRSATLEGKLCLCLHSGKCELILTAPNSSISSVVLENQYSSEKIYFGVMDSLTYGYNKAKPNCSLPAVLKVTEKIHSSHWWINMCSLSRRYNELYCKWVCLSEEIIESLLVSLLLHPQQLTSPGEACLKSEIESTRGQVWDSCWPWQARGGKIPGKKQVGSTECGIGSCTLSHLAQLLWHKGILYFSWETAIGLLAGCRFVIVGIWLQRLHCLVKFWISYSRMLATFPERLRGILLSRMKQTKIKIK